MKLGQRHLAALLLCLMAGSPALAGRACEPAPAVAANVAKSLDLALKTRTALDAAGAQVALVARVGQDLSKYKLVYSHVGLAWRDHPDGRWLVVHELNGCGTNTSELYNDGLGNFFLDDVFEYKAALIIPNMQTQARLAALLGPAAALRLHAPRYNMLAFPFSTKYQNSNQWVLETYAAASEAPGRINDRAQAQQWLRAADYAPTTLDIPASTRLGGRMFRANIAFDDHPFGRRMAGQIDTVTVESIMRFIRARDPEAKILEVAL
ncbi:MAG: DUF2145 domain-containing protein [Pseudomonadota bacterium]